MGLRRQSRLPAGGARRVLIAIARVVPALIIVGIVVRLGRLGILAGDRRRALIVAAISGLSAIGLADPSVLRRGVRPGWYGLEVKRVAVGGVRQAPPVVILDQLGGGRMRGHRFAAELKFD